MKYDGDLNPIPDDAGDDGSNSNNGAGRADSNSSGSGDAIGQLRIGGEDVGNGDGVGTDKGADDNDSLPLGVPTGNGKSARDNDPSRSGSNRRRGRSNRGAVSNGSGAGTDTRDNGAGSGTQETPLTATTAVPRPVKFQELGGSSSARDKKLTRDFIAEGYTLLFDVTGSALRDKETWELEKADAQELAERTHAFWQSLDKSKSAKWEKMLAKWQPLLMLLMALIAIVGPRIAQTSAKRKNAVNLRKEAGGGGGTATLPAPPATNVAPVANQPVFRPEPSNGPVPDRAGQRPLRREDFQELFGETVGGTV